MTDKLLNNYFSIIKFDSQNEESGVIDIHEYSSAIPIICPDHHFFSRHVVNLDFRYIVFGPGFNDQFPLKGIGINLYQVVKC